MKDELCRLLRDEECALLTTCQLKFLDEVNAAVDTKLQSVDKSYLNAGDERDIEVTSKISALEDNVILIITHLREGKLSWKNFIETYPEWKTNRDNCVVQLLDIADSLKSDRFNCNVSKLVGYCASAFGGGITLTSAILIPLTVGLATPLAIGGATLIAAGATTAVGTSITEIALLKSKVDKAKVLIEKDKDYFGRMSDWLNHASDLQEALSNVLDFDIIKDIAEEVQKFVEDAIAITSEPQRTLSIEKALNKIFTRFLPKFEQITVLTRDIRDIANIISILVAVFLLMSNTKNRLIFDGASLTIRSILGACSLVNESFNILGLSKAHACNAAIAKYFSRAVTRGAVALVGIALDMVGIVFTSIDIHKGSKSPEAEKIVNAATSLREEADVLEGVYQSVDTKVAFDPLPPTLTLIEETTFKVRNKFVIRLE